MSKVIIHISDLHVTLFKKSNGIINPKIDSYLTTNNEDSSSIHFIDTFTTKILEGFKESERFLIITGDITESGEIKEFDFAFSFIKRIIDDLKINIKNCLILPGDHDVHRRSLENELEREPNDNAHLLNNIKFNNFSSLYKNIIGKDFPFDNIIIDYINIEDKIILLGINSNFKINNEGGEGFIPIVEFNKEFERLKAELANESLNYIACWHHNFSSGFENRNDGQWESQNRKHLLAELERQNIKFVFTGNEHTSNCKSVYLDSILSSDCGSFSSISHDTTFKIYPVIINKDVKLANKIYALQKINGNDLSYFWDLRDNNGAKQLEFFDLFIENIQKIEEVDDVLPHIDNEKITTDSELMKVNSSSRVFYENPEIADRLYDIIKNKKLFHSGHFHWSENSRAHNWIDVSKLLEDKEDLYFVKNVIIDIIEKYNLQEKCDLMIGLGYEGNIISSKASIKFNIPYTSLPYSYRYNDHNEYEKSLNYDNGDEKFKRILFITDVVNDGRTIRKLIHEREKQFFEKVEKIIVVSLFYSGHQEVHTDILNYSKLLPNYDKGNDYEVENIEFYTVKSLRVEKCPYGKNYKEQCFIYKDDLSCVHLFYDEKVEE
jgi:orotate phosphoribosyltransferase/3',5'-cyclic AMP phosphodiesterase CpdA